MSEKTGNNIKLLELCLSEDLGGLELYVLNAAIHLNQSFQTHLLLSDRGKLHEKALENHLSFDTLRSHGKYSIKTFLTLKEYIQKNGIDIVHLHWVKDLPLVVFVKLFAKKKFKIIYTRHISLKKKKQDPYHSFLYKNVDRIIAITKAIEDDLVANLPDSCVDRIETLYMSTGDYHENDDQQEIISLKGLFESSQKIYKIGVFARIEPLKGQLEVLKAVEKLLKLGINCQLFFVGNVLDEGYYKSLIDYANESHIHEHVFFVGFVNNPKSLMRLCDVTVLASRSEAFGLVIIESMQMGVPVIASRIGGIPEIIEDKVNGLMFDLDDEDGLIEALIALYKDERVRTTIIENAKENVNKRFSATAHYQRLTAILISL